MKLQELFENKRIPANIDRAARAAGYDTSLLTLIKLKIAYANRAIKAKYADQFDVRLGELLDMIKMDKDQLKDFIKKNDN